MNVEYILLLLIACWLFAIATFLRIFLTGQSHVLDKKMGDFLKEFPGLALAVGSIMTLTTLLIPKAVILLIGHTFSDSRYGYGLRLLLR